MPELEEQLRRYAAAAERSVTPAPLPVRGAARGWYRWLAVAAAAAVVGAALVVTLEEDDSHLSTDPSTSTPPCAPTTRGVETTTTGPATRTGRSSPVVAVIECGPGANCVRPDEYLVWAGEAGANDTSHRADGFAVDLSTGAVRPIPVAPIDPRSVAAGVWTGEELIVCCGTGRADGFPMDTRSAAAWDPYSGAWRVLAQPPEAIARAFATAVWTGEVMVVVAPGGAATYDPSTDEWDEVAAPTLRGRQPQAAWTGATVILWDSFYGGDSGWVWSPGDDEWTAMPPLPDSLHTSFGSMAWTTGTELVVWGQSAADENLAVGARWRPGEPDRWLPIAAWPHNPVENWFEGTPGSQGLAATDDGRVLVKGLDGSAAVHTDLYDPVTDTWEDLGFTLGGFHPTITVSGNKVLIPDEARAIVATIPPRSES